MSAADRYLDQAEALTLLAVALPATDKRLVIFAGLATDALRESFLVRATRRIDAVGYAGARAGGSTQSTAFPRVGRNGDAVDPDPDEPTAPAPPVTGVPRGVRIACALQAATEAAAAAGVGAALHLQEAANRGVVSQSVRGRSETVDARYARSPWGRLCIEAKDELARYRRRSSAIV